MGRLRRALHFVPGANEKLLRKSLTLPADSLILDLEDAVAPEQKDDARSTVTAWLREVDFGRQERIVRINPLDTPWGTRDESERGFPQGEVKLLVLATETPAGLLSIRELALCPRVDALTWGPEDLAAAIGARRNRDEQGRDLEVFRYARVMTLLAAASAGVQPVDTVYVDIRDDEGFRRECRDSSRTASQAAGSSASADRWWMRPTSPARVPSSSGRV
jgi:citrate lyase subunit beta/citryl-CoA lyase